MIEAIGLTKRYGPVAAAEDVSFQVAEGEVVGLLGANGAGKTTVLRMLAGVLTPTAGRAFIDGISVADEPLRTKARLGFLSGDTALYQRLTPREVLRYFGQLHELAPAKLARRIDELVALLDMSEFADRPCAKLSAGQKQRANIARAFVHDPKALVLDEPTSALDIVTGRFLLDAVKAARGAGKAIIFSTHVMGEAEYLCDRVVMLHGGAVLDAGPIDELCRRGGADNLTDAFLARVEAANAAPARRERRP